jgi:hypothetical protein
MPYKANEPRRHKIPKARYRIENEYDAALWRRGSLTVWVMPEALEAWAPEKSGQRPTRTSGTVKLLGGSRALDGEQG